MKKKIAKMWVDALRSGDYKQGSGRLRDFHDQFCCLGVLCNLHALAHPSLAMHEKSRAHYLGFETLLPPRVREWAGMSSVNGAMNGNSNLAWYNDACGYSFKEIANLIEEHLEKL